MDFLYGINQWILSSVFLLLLFAAVEAGVRLGKKRTNIKNDSQFGRIVSSVMGLMALLLGFTFSMSLSRFAARRDLIIEETNAIAMGCSRVQFLPPAKKAESLEIFKTYVPAAQQSLSFSETDRERYNVAAAQLELMQNTLWSVGLKASESPKPSPMLGLYMTALNQMTAVHAKSVYEREQHVPQPVLVLLYGIATLSFWLLGYGCGQSGERHAVATTTMILLITAVLFIIIDIDRPSRGFIMLSDITFNCSSPAAGQQ